jgi:hypothetical protein
MMVLSAWTMSEPGQVAMRGDGTEVVGHRRPNGAAMSTSCTRSVDCMADKHDVNRTIRRLVGVYNANGSVSGELAYFIGARLGRAHRASVAPGPANL